MTSVDSNFNFLCGRPHGAGPLPPRPPEPDPPPCGRHKWMAPFLSVCLSTGVHLSKIFGGQTKILGVGGKRW